MAVKFITPNVSQISEGKDLETKTLILKQNIIWKREHQFTTEPLLLLMCC
jgi:hypothetical protein